MEDYIFYESLTPIQLPTDEEIEHEKKILDLFDDYFKSASSEGIARDVAFVNSIGTNGITLEEYLDNLNHVTSHTH